MCGLHWNIRKTLNFVKKEINFNKYMKNVWKLMLIFFKKTNFERLLKICCSPKNIIKMQNVVENRILINMWKVRKRKYVNEIKDILEYEKFVVYSEILEKSKIMWNHNHDFKKYYFVLKIPLHLPIFFVLWITKI